MLVTHDRDRPADAASGRTTSGTPSSSARSRSLFPILILIGTATRLAAARREERYAALRLVGATTRQISVISSVDAVVSALLGALLGIALFALLQPALAGTAITSPRYFADEVTPDAGRLPRSC